MGCNPMSTRTTVFAAMAALAAIGAPQPAWSHGAAGGEELLPGEFRIRPVVTLEGHAGLENNLDGQPRHYAIDGLFGAVFEWGLDKGGSLPSKPRSARLWCGVRLSISMGVFMSTAMKRGMATTGTRITAVMAMRPFMITVMGTEVPIAGRM
jgi:hypothetical protein